MDFLIPHTGTIFWMLISFSVVLYVLKKFAWKPILGALKQREESIDKALRSAKEATKEMERLQANNEKIMAEAKRERDQIIKEAREMKNTILNDAKVQASAEAAKIIDDARVAIKNEKTAAIKEMKEQIATFSIQIAESILQEKFENTKNQEEYITKLLGNVKLK